ncbi:MAG TPA: RNA methyltransferase [Xanthomonadaceae bacterium]|jgi:tRNA (cytidine32/uridine32-2'-O)-methyltransferase
MSTDSLDHAVRIVLVGTQHPGNLGSAARAMKTMALHELVLVAPQRPPDHQDALAMAAGADDVLAAARVCATLEEAIADCGFVAGCTARQRQVMLPEFEPREAAPRLLDEARNGPVALVFGPERTGLTNEDLQRCHATVHIPANPVYSSLNLAAAVQVLCYELRLAMLERAVAEDAGTESVRGDPPATQAQMEAFFDHLGQTLDAIDFHKGRSPVTVMRRLRGLFLRAQPDARELRILRGIFADAERMARLAGDDA